MSYNRGQAIKPNQPLLFTIMHVSSNNMHKNEDFLLLLETLAQTKTTNSTRETAVYLAIQQYKTDWCVIQQYKVDWCVSGYI